VRAIVIGHRGLIGSAVASHLRSVDVDVLGVDRGNYSTAVGQTADLLVNAGGSPDKRLAAERPLDGFRVNVEDVLRTISDFPSDQYVHMSTASVYGRTDDPSRNQEDVTIDPGALAPYGAFKYMAEVLVRAFAKRWSILRVGPVVGPGLRRNAIFDLLRHRSLFVSPESTLCYIDSGSVARAVWELREPAGEIHNVAGRGTVRLANVAEELGIELPRALWTLPVERMALNVEKALARMELPSTGTVVREFAAAWRRAERTSSLR
jgi:nucleoside-diphosphate-sugar epimerase